MLMHLPPNLRIIDSLLKKKKITITVSLRVQASLSPKKWCKKGDSGGLDSDVCIESENFPIGL